MDNTETLVILGTQDTGGRQTKQKVQSRMDNTETLEILGTQDTGGRQTKQKDFKPGYISITCSKISKVPYNLISTTKFNDSSILITIISCDYLNLSLANEYVDDVFHQQISISRWRSKCYLDGGTYKVNIRKTAFTSNKPCVDFEKRVVYVELPQKVLSSLPKCPDASFHVTI
jgi:hypothetical protein